MAIKAPVGESQLGRTCTEHMEVGDWDEDRQFLSIRTKGPGKKIQIFGNDSGADSIWPQRGDVLSYGMPNLFGIHREEPNPGLNGLLEDGRNIEKKKTKESSPPIQFSSTSGIKTLQPRQHGDPSSVNHLPLKKRGHLSESVPYSRKSSHDEKVKKDLRNLNAGKDDQNDMRYAVTELNQLMIHHILHDAVQKGTCISINGKLHRITANPVLSSDSNRQETIFGIIDRPPPQVQTSSDQYEYNEIVGRYSGMEETEQVEEMYAERSMERVYIEIPDEPLNLSLKTVHQPSQSNDPPDREITTDEIVGNYSLDESQTSLISIEKGLEDVNGTNRNPIQGISHEVLRIVQAFNQMQTGRTLLMEKNTVTAPGTEVEDNVGIAGKPSLPDLNSLELTDGDGCYKESSTERIKEGLRKKITKK